MTTQKHQPCAICGKPNDKGDFCQKCAEDYFKLPDSQDFTGESILIAGLEAELEKRDRVITALDQQLCEMTAIVKRLIDYRDRNASNLQVEKLDDFINALRVFGATR